MANPRYKNFKDWNDQMLKKFDLEHYHDNSNLAIKWVEAKRVKSILKFIQAEKGDRIIEIGCGAGDILGKIKQGDLLGLDISKYILEIARKRYPQIRFVLGNAEALPGELSQSQYDKIIISEVLEHLENPQKALEGIKKIAKPESVIVASFPNENLINRAKGFLERLKIFKALFPKLSLKMTDEWHLHSFDLDQIRKMTDKDYVIQAIQGIPFNWLALRYVIKMKIK